MPQRFEEKKQSLKFRDSKTGNILDGVELVIVEGAYDNQKREYVDKPTMVIGYGWVRPNQVAENSNIPIPK